jgi:hypothetical protein
VVSGGRWIAAVSTAALRTVAAACASYVSALARSAYPARACSRAALASASSAATGSLRDAYFSAADVASCILRSVLSLLQHHTTHNTTVSTPLRCEGCDFEGATPH